MNILLTASGIPKIADFGIARVLKPQDSLVDPHRASSQGGTGNRDYMSPEQLREEPADFLSDLFMVGITGYLLLCGRHPFAHPSGLFAIQEMIADPNYLPEVPRGSFKTVLEE
jgi:serine/threonine protein kinase